MKYGRSWLTISVQDGEMSEDWNRREIAPLGCVVLTVFTSLQGYRGKARIDSILSIRGVEVP